MLAREAGPLVEAGAWEGSDAEHDPMAEHRPEIVECPAIGWQVEGGALEVSTGACNYLSIEQPLLRDVGAGTPVVVELWHQTLHAEEPATGHVALFVDGMLLWERQVEIPGPPAIWTDTVEAPSDLLVGDRVVFHLHNHGVNTWYLGDVVSEFPPD